ncbi:unnamed protein product [Effrenium voratum]|uniref:Uncharacterized protein n=1 Tax=Effrenium voratum TaxID=2562239 RepID=A0AA36NH25_9DINO|nr:unnamed protein product [Effrenium voratum]
MKAKSAKAKSKRLGKAESLTGDAWRHVRVTEALKLKLVHLQDKWLTVPALKAHGEIRKPITPSAERFLRKLEANGGERVPRSRKWGSRGVRTYQDEWVWPKKNEDYLFPALREDAELQRRNKDVVSAAIRRIRKSYTPPATSPTFGLILAGSEA